MRAAAILCLAAAGAGHSIAGVVLTGQSVDFRDNNEVTDFTMLVDASRLRTNMKGKDVDASVIFHVEGEDYKMMVVDNTKKEYRVIDRKTMQEINEKVGGAMAQMQEQMKKMTPEQRAMMEKLMGRMGGTRQGQPPSPPETVFQKTGPGNVNGRDCTKYDGLSEGQKISELCAAPPDSLNLTSSDLAVFEKMGAIFEEMTKSLRQLPYFRSSSPKLIEKQIDGIPVQQIQFENGQQTSKLEFKDSARRSFSDADFSVGDAKLLEMPTGLQGK
jgi:hypothetical protein